MNILMAASEMAPFAETGDMGESLLALSTELAKLGHEVSVALPFYRQIRENRKWKTKSINARLNIPMGNQRRIAEIFETRATNGVQVFLVRRDEYFDRSGLYGANDEDYQDNAERFIFFTKCVVELAKRMEPAPQVLHAHDWQTALLPLFVKAQQIPAGTALTIHDLAYQGNFWSYDFALTNLAGEWFSPKGAEFYGSMNCIKGGIVQADAVIVESAPYSNAIQTPEYGCGLDAVFRENAGKLHGIPDGLDVAVPNGGEKNARRDSLLKHFSLSPSPKGPVMIMDARETAGLSLLFPMLDRLLAEDVRLLLSGKPEAALQAELKTFLLRHRGKMALMADGDEPSPYAGADTFLLPTHAANKRPLLIALQHGVIPLVLACGGLSQIVQEYDASVPSGNGFVFYERTPEAFLDGFRHARKVFSDQAQWRSIVQAAMQSDFSWQASAKAHEAIYQKIARPSS